jgi:hypothetical protein
MDIPIFYDPMIAKLVVHAATREEAIERLCRAIDEYQIKGIQTTLPFGKWGHFIFRILGSIAGAFGDDILLKKLIRRKGRMM